MHLHASAAYMRWKVDKDFSEENENEIGRQMLFWAKVLQRLISIILKMAALTLAFRGHREQVHDNICEGGNFLALVSLMAEYDEFLAEVISLPGRATNYLSPKIQDFGKNPKYLIMDFGKKYQFCTILEYYLGFHQ